MAGASRKEILKYLNADWITHYSAGATWHSREQATHFLAAIQKIVATMAHCDVILYQAGADLHMDDPLGGWLATAQLRKRDRAVFESARRLGVPIAWNLAGGYQTPLSKVLRIHDNTMLECVSVYGNL